MEYLSICLLLHLIKVLESISPFWNHLEAWVQTHIHALLKKGLMDIPKSEAGAF